MSQISAECKFVFVLCFAFLLLQPEFFSIPFLFFALEYSRIYCVYCNYFQNSFCSPQRCLNPALFDKNDITVHQLTVDHLYRNCSLQIYIVLYFEIYIFSFYVVLEVRYVCFSKTQKCCTLTVSF